MIDLLDRLRVIQAKEATIYETVDYLFRLASLAENDLGSVRESFEISDRLRDLRSNCRKRVSSSCSIERDHASFSGGKRPKRDVSDDSSILGHELSEDFINKHWREKICEWWYRGELD